MISRNMASYPIQMTLFSHIKIIITTIDNLESCEIYIYLAVKYLISENRLVTI